MGASLFYAATSFHQHWRGNYLRFGLRYRLALAIIGLAAIREKMAYSDVPAPLKGLGIHFHHCRFDGNGIYVFLWFENLKGKE